MPLGRPPHWLTSAMHQIVFLRAPGLCVLDAHEGTHDQHLKLRCRIVLEGTLCNLGQLEYTYQIVYVGMSQSGKPSH